jgi:hypothetical protein
MRIERLPSHADATSASTDTPRDALDEAMPKELRRETQTVSGHSVSLQICYDDLQI